MDIIKAILNWALTSLGMIGHGLAVLGNWLLTGLGMIGHGLGAMGSWLATNTATIANLFYTSAAAHPVITISIPLLVLASPLIISSYREFFNSKGAYDVNGDGQSSSLGSDEFNKRQGDGVNENRTCIDPLLLEAYEDYISTSTNLVNDSAER